MVGKKKAKEMWFANPKLTAREALEIGLINKVVPDDKLREETRAMATAISERGAFALASLKAAFTARHGGVGGLGRISHDLLLRLYLDKMAGYGAPKVSFDDAMLNVRQQLMTTLAWWTITLNPAPGMPDMQPPAITYELIRRIAAAMDDMDALDAFC